MEEHCLVEHAVHNRRVVLVGPVGDEPETVVVAKFVELGSPWENGYVESFNGKLRDELINREVFTTLLEAKILIENWRRDYTTRFAPIAPSGIGLQPLRLSSQP